MGTKDNPARAMILAAGAGTRLKPLTIKTPKALLPIDGTPLIVHQIGWLKSWGISQVAINLHHLGIKIKEFLGDGSRFGVKITYSPEEILLGTAGGVKRMESLFTETFVVLYGDVLTDFNLGNLIKFHRTKKSIATLALIEVNNAENVGVVEIDEKGRVKSFIEKPRGNYKTKALGNGGVYVLEKDIFNYIPREGFSDFAYNTFPDLIKYNMPLYGYVLDTGSYLLDIGIMDNYQKANGDVKAGKVKVRHEL